MIDEIPSRPGQEADSGHAAAERDAEHSPLQARAAFIENWDWELINSLNRGACERGRAQHGHNRETHAHVQQRWEQFRTREVTFGETLRFLRECHRGAPFLFFNGNTFAEVARRTIDVLLAEFPIGRRREAASLAAHYVAGVLDWESMDAGLSSLTETPDFRLGDRVKTFRGTTRGVIVRIHSDGRIAWKPDGAHAELLALPDSMLPDKDRRV